MSEINKSVTKTVQSTLDIPVTAEIKWLMSVAEPTAPAGYARAVELDLDLGLIGKWWAFLKVS